MVGSAHPTGIPSPAAMRCEPLGLVAEAGETDTTEFRREVPDCDIDECFLDDVTRDQAIREMGPLHFDDPLDALRRMAYLVPCGKRFTQADVSGRIRRRGPEHRSGPGRPSRPDPKANPRVLS